MMAILSRRRLVMLGGAGVTSLTAAVTAQAQIIRSPQPDLRQLFDRATIIDTVNAIGLGADLRDWQMCRAAFADRVEVDYTSLMGGTPNKIAADMLIAQWTDFFQNTFKTTQHLIGNHAVTVEGDRASCLSQFQAHHVFLDTARGNFWTLGGVYRHSLSRKDDRWQVTQMQMTWTWENGIRPF